MTRRILSASIVFLGFGFLLAPILVVITASFAATSPFTFPPSGYTLRAYGQISASYVDALKVSLAVAGSTSVLAAMFGAPAALALARGRFPGRGMLNALFLSPLTIPALVTGVALFDAAGVFSDITGVDLGATIPGLIAGHVTFGVPLVIRAVLADHTRYDHAIEEAALSLGATPMQTFWRVTLPILRPGIASGAVFAFLMSFDDVPIALFMGGGEATTLPVKIYAALSFAFGSDLFALASLIIAGSMVAVFVLDRLIGLERLFAAEH